jgi:ElaB/YqjD/DUF883 family membrane-anchored ribosome-binding protein
MHNGTRKHKASKYNLAGDLNNIIQKLTETRESIAQATQDVKGSAQETLFQKWDDIHEGSVEIEESIAGYIQDKPFKSVGIALGVGLVIGYFFR